MSRPSRASEVFGNPDLRAYILGFCGRGHNLLDYFVAHADTPIGPDDLVAALDRGQFEFVHYALAERVVRSNCAVRPNSAVRSRRVAAVPPSVASLAFEIAAELGRKEELSERAQAARECARALAAAAGTLEFRIGCLEAQPFVCRLGARKEWDQISLESFELRKIIDLRPGELAECLDEPALRRVAIAACAAHGAGNPVISARETNIAVSRILFENLFGWPQIAREGAKMLPCKNEEKIIRAIAGLCRLEDIPDDEVLPSALLFYHEKYLKAIVDGCEDFSDIVSTTLRFAEIFGKFRNDNRCATTLKRTRAYARVGGAALLLAFSADRGADAVVARALHNYDLAAIFDGLRYVYWFLQRALSTRFGSSSNTRGHFGSRPAECSPQTSFAVRLSVCKLGLGPAFVGHADCLAPQTIPELLNEAALAGAVRWLVAAGAVGAGAVGASTRCTFWPGAAAAELLETRSVSFVEMWADSPAAVAWLARRVDCDAEFFAAAVRAQFADDPEMTVVRERVGALCDAVVACTGGLPSVDSASVGDFRTAIVLAERRRLTATKFSREIVRTISAESLSGWSLFPTLFQDTFAKSLIEEKALLHAHGRAQGWLTARDTVVLVDYHLEQDLISEILVTCARDFMKTSRQKIPLSCSRNLLQVPESALVVTRAREEFQNFIGHEGEFLEVVTYAAQHGLLRFKNCASFVDVLGDPRESKARSVRKQVRDTLSRQYLFAHAPDGLTRSDLRALWKNTDAMAILHWPREHCSLAGEFTIDDCGATFLNHLRWTRLNCPRCFARLTAHCARKPLEFSALRQYVSVPDHTWQQLETLLPEYSDAVRAAAALPEPDEIIDAVQATFSTSANAADSTGFIKRVR